LKNAVLTVSDARWALTNPHLSLHIPDESRLAVSTQRKRNGMPRRPPLSLKSVMANIHLLTGVPSFARWPLNLHFFAREARSAWDAWLSSTGKAAREGLEIVEDFGPATGDTGTAAGTSSSNPWGIHALPLDYNSMRAYAEKTSNVVSFEQEGTCVHCNGTLETGKGLHAMCPNDGCEAMGHLTCWGKQGGDRRGGNVIPQQCTCPSCGGRIRWGDMMKELTLRERGGKEVERLLKKGSRGRKAAA
jgi:structure-specific endonuclease subunit SLX1